MPVPSNVSTKLAPKDTPWSAPTLSDFTNKQFSALSALEKKHIAGHFAWANELPPSTYGDLYLPHHRASDGAVVFRGVAAALARLDQTDIGADAKRQAKAHLEAHMAQFKGKDPSATGRALDDESLIERVLEFPPFLRAATVASVDDQARTVDVVFSTGADVKRRDYSGSYIERLSMEPSAVRLGRLNAGAPLLDTHMGYSVRSQLGAVVPGSARIANGQGLATVKFSRRADADAVFQDVKDGVVRSLSAGYLAHRIEEQRAATLSDLPVRTAVDWEPYELSMCPIPQDIGAQVRSEDPEVLHRCVILARGEALDDVTDEDADRLRRLRLAMAMARS